MGKESTLERAKRIMGSQFNEEAWKNQIKQDESKAEKMLDNLEKNLKRKK